MPIRILIADDHTLLREGFKSMLEPEPEFSVVAEAGDGLAATKAALTLKPEIAVLDIGMPEMNGLEAARIIKAKAPEIEIVILSVHSDREYVIQALKVGVKGYLLKNCTGSEVIDALRTVARKGTYLCPAISGVLANEITASGSGDRSLSPRELQVLRYMAEGMCIKEIAFQLGIGAKTVETYRRSLKKKLGISNLAELTKHAIRTGLIDID